MLKEQLLPVPYYHINECLDILAASAEALAVFPETESFRQLIDEDSRIKADSLINPLHSGMRVELNLQTRDNPMTLFEVYQSWDSDGTGYLVCICQQRNFEQIFRKLHHLREKIEQGVLEEGSAPNAIPLRPTGSGRTGNAELQSALDTIREFVNLFKPDLIEVNKGEYADIILAQVDRALEAAKLSGRPVRRVFHKETDPASCHNQYVRS